MRDLLTLTIHLLVTCIKLLRPGDVRAVAAESLLLKHEILISNRSRLRAPNLTTLDRFVLGLTTLFIGPQRISKLSALLAAGRFCIYDFQCDFGGKSTCPRTTNQYLRPRFVTSYRTEIARCDRA